MKKKNSRKLPKDTIKPYNKKQYELFAFWSSIPMALRELTGDKLRRMGYDSSDEKFMKLMSIRTRTEFADEFKITRRQMYEWENDDDFKKLVNKFNSDSNVLAFKKDIDFQFTMKTINEGDASRVKLWKQLFENWTERSETRSPALEELGRAIKEIAERRAHE